MSSVCPHGLAVGRPDGLIRSVIRSVTHFGLAGRSADLQSAVSPICNRQRTGHRLARRAMPHSAECNSAIQQIANLRYVNASELLTT